jgi:glycosyltransferase involved in cell wall biosynthesis
LGGEESSLLAAKGVIDADAAAVATQFQRDQFPEELQSKIAVLHEGIDDSLFCLNDDQELQLGTPSGRLFKRTDEIVTFATRSLEPLRGYHVFLRAAQLIFARRPRTIFLVAGNEHFSYSGPPPAGSNWRRFLECQTPVTPERLHFLGLLDRKRHAALLKISTAHVYLTAPFVLSWSLLKAMALGAAIAASDTAPVREFVKHGESGLLCKFFDFEGLANRIEDISENRTDVQALRNGARESVQHLKASHCVHLWCEKLASLLPGGTIGYHVGAERR